MMSFTWDGENRLHSAGGATYVYDAEGNRVEKQGAGVTDTIFFAGRPVARLSAGQWTDLIYGPNGLIAEVPGTENGAPVYRLLDHLGNEVGTSDSSAALNNPLDYTPYGQIFAGNTNDPYLFTGKERDTESGLDYFGARYYGSSMGRWMSPDWASNPVTIPFANIYDPQSLNLYSYVGNNPLNRFDPNGHLDCSGGATQDVACAVTAAAKAVWHWLSSGSGDSGGNAPSGSVTSSQQDNFTPQQMGQPQQSMAPRNVSLNFGGSAELGLGAGYAGMAQGSAVWDFKSNHVYGLKTAGGSQSAVYGQMRIRALIPRTGCGAYMRAEALVLL